MFCFEDESILVNFLNKEENYIRLSNEDIGREYEIESSYIECICKIILTNDDINKKSFEHLLDNTKYICDIYLGKNKSFEEFVEYNLNIINYKKVKIIIDKNIIKLNIENYKTLKAKPGDEHIHLIENNIDVYLNNINKYDLSINNTIELLESSKIDNDHKSLIINNLDVEDKLLIADDSDIDRLVKYLLNYKYKLKYEILNYVINSDISIENKVFILSNQIEHLDEDYIDDLLRKLGDNYKYIVDKGRLPILYNNYANIKLVNALINKKYISTWGINKDNKIKVNRKTKSS